MLKLLNKCFGRLEVKDEAKNKKMPLSGFTPLEMQSKSNDSLRKRQRRFLSLTGFTPLETKTQPVKIKRFLTGFTLSELLLASAILAFVLAGLLALFVTCIFLNEASRNLTIATGHAQLVLEEIKNTNFSNIKSGSIDPNTYWDLNIAAITSRGLFVLSNESIETQGAWIDSDKEQLDVTVTLAWKDRGLRDRSIYLRTLITEP